MVDVATEVVVGRLTDLLPKASRKALSHTSLYGERVKIGQRDHTQKDANASTFSVKIGHAQCKALADTLADKLAEAKAEHLGHTQSAAKAETLVDTLADNEASKNETFKHTR